MGHRLDFQVDRLTGTELLPVDVSRGYNLGFTVRDAAKMQAHLDEVAKEGVTPPVCETPPLIFPISSWAWLTGDECHVQTEHTSGEVEIFMLDTADELFVSVASDHTDRRLEGTDIPLVETGSPQHRCPDVVGVERCGRALGRMPTRLLGHRRRRAHALSERRRRRVLEPAGHGRRSCWQGARRDSTGVRERHNRVARTQVDLRRDLGTAASRPSARPVDRPHVSRHCARKRGQQLINSARALCYDACCTNDEVTPGPRGAHRVRSPPTPAQRIRTPGV